MAFKLNEKTLEPHNGDYIAFLKEIEKGNAKVSGLTVSVSSDSEPLPEKGFISTSLESSSGMPRARMAGERARASASERPEESNSAHIMNTAASVGSSDRANFMPLSAPAQKEENTFTFLAAATAITTMNTDGTMSDMRRLRQNTRQPPSRCRRRCR